MTAGDRAGKSHWDDTWRSASVPAPVQPQASGLRDYVNREFAKLLRRWLAHERTNPALIEFGCARSIWLPFLANTLHYSVTGIDYTQRGCELARATLAAANVPGEIVLGDFFDPPPELLGRFDAAASFGVAEHFDDTSTCISAFARFLRPGGRLVTVIPNLTGITGFVQKHLNRAVYDKHVPLDSEQLRRAHRAAGLDVVAHGYLVSTNFGLLNLEGLPAKGPSFLWKRLVVAALGRLSMATWALEPHFPTLQVSAGYAYCVADAHRSS
jgi:SAM-dependent methyltransferase